MSNFPFNIDKYKYGEDADWNGSPLTLGEARNFADKILFWHTNNNLSDFSQSGDGFDDGVNDLAFGLVELLSDPNAIHRLMTTGKGVIKTMQLVLDSNTDHCKFLKEKLKKEFLISMKE
jgi:hypothetical protein